MAKLGAALAAYSQRADQELRNEVERRDLSYHKKGQHIDLGGSDKYIILTSPNGSRWSVTVSNAGALVVTAL